jgi:hypothetical protein
MAGDIPVKLAWGKAQEAAALHCLLQLFPVAAVEEVGVICATILSTFNKRLVQYKYSAKLAWGKAQEAAALHCLLQLLPEAAVEEASASAAAAPAAAAAAVFGM